MSTETVLVIRITDHLNKDGTIRRREGGVVDVLESGRTDGTHTGPLGGLKGSMKFLLLPCPWLHIEQAHHYKGADPNDLSINRADVDWRTLFDTDQERADVLNRNKVSPIPKRARITPDILKRGPAFGRSRNPNLEFDI